MEENAPLKNDPGGLDITTTEDVQSSELEATNLEDDSVNFSSQSDNPETKIEEPIISEFSADESSNIHAPTNDAVVDALVQSVDCSDSKSINEVSGANLISTDTQQSEQSTTIVDVTNEPDIPKNDDESKENFQIYEEDSSKSFSHEDSSSKKNFEVNTF